MVHIINAIFIHPCGKIIGKKFQKSMSFFIVCSAILVNKFNFETDAIHSLELDIICEKIPFSMNKVCM
jgi:hypothetical protein